MAIILSEIVFKQIMAMGMKLKIEKSAISLELSSNIKT